MADSEDRSEQPTQRRIEKAREDGKVLSSRQLVVAMQILIVYYFFFREIGATSRRLLEAWIQGFREVFVEQTAQVAMVQLLGPLEKSLLPWLATMIGATALVALAAQLAISQGSIRWKNLAPQPNKLFNMVKLLEGWKGIHKKLPLFLVASFSFLLASLIPSYLEASVLHGMRRIDLKAQIAYYGEALLSGAQYALGLFLVIGAVDFGLKFYKLSEELKMTKKEVKDESKESNGNPLIKAALKRRMKALLSNRMMQKVPEATVLVVNPTHFAVALHYDPETSDAPMVTAKGVDFLALRMRRKAEECGVPVVENPPLAQSLYKSAEVGQRIPVELYRAVAEVLAYVFRVLGRQAPAA